MAKDAAPGSSSHSMGRPPRPARTGSALVAAR